MGPKPDILENKLPVWFYCCIDGHYHPNSTPETVMLWSPTVTCISRLLKGEQIFTNEKCPFLHHKLKVIVL